MEAPTESELQGMKYSELQRLAKGAGLRANQRADKLLKSLKQHFLHEPKEEKVGQDSESSQSSFTLTDDDDDSASHQEKSPVPMSHVTKRRGRGQVADKITSSTTQELNSSTEITNEEQPKDICQDKENSPSQEKPAGMNKRKRSRPEELADEQISFKSPAEGSTVEAVPPVGKIPRLVGRKLKSETTLTKPTTPNFKKMHEAHFKKMESIDKFVERNKKRLEALGNPNRVAKSTHHAKKANSDLEKHSGLSKNPKCTRDFTAEQTIGVVPLIKPTNKNQAKGNIVEAVTPSKNIPPYARRHSKLGDVRLKATTPNLKKLKESHVEKMSLLDDYIDRKQERLNAITNSIQEVKMLAEKKILLKQVGKQESVSNYPKKNMNRVSLFSPVPPRGRHSFACTPSSQRRSPRTSINLANRSILTEKNAFKPSILSSSKMNVRFSEATKDNEHKRSLTKTPARRSPYVQVDSDTPSNQQIKIKPIRKSLGKPVNPDSTLEKCKTEEFTPFKFNGEKSETPSTNKKSTFDIKASLARPLGYEPHKGKLKPWVDGNENPGTLTKSVNCSLSILKKEYKQPHLQTRESRRDEHIKGRKNKKDEMIGTRRGLILA